MAIFDIKYLFPLFVKIRRSFSQHVFVFQMGNDTFSMLILTISQSIYSLQNFTFNQRSSHWTKYLFLDILFNLRKLQCIQNGVARIAYNTSRYNRITSDLITSLLTYTMTSYHVTKCCNING